MSVLDEIPAFSIWETFNETIPALMSMKSSEKSAEHLAKIIKSGDFSNIFVYNKDPSMSFDDYNRVSNKYKSFTTWFLGRFFYLLSCEKLNKSHGVFVDIQLYVLEQLSSNELSVYEEFAKEYCSALNSLTKFVKFGNDSIALDVFVPEKYTDLCTKLNLEPASIEITKQNWELFLLNLLKIVRFVLNQRFQFASCDPITRRAINDLLFLLGECPLTVKLEILKMSIGHSDPRFVFFFEQVVYNIYSKKFTVTQKEVDDLETLILEFLETNFENETFLKVTEYLLSAKLEIQPSDNIQTCCWKKRTQPLYSSEDFEDFPKSAFLSWNSAVLCGLKKQIMKDIDGVRSNQEGSEEIRIYTSGTWGSFYGLLVESMDVGGCGACCHIPQFLKFMTDLTHLLMETQVHFKNSPRIQFLEESMFLLRCLALMNRHFASCEQNLPFASLYKFLLNLATISGSSLPTFFKLFTCVFTQPSNEYTGRFKKEFTDFCTFLAQFQTDKTLAFDYLNRLITRISSGFFELPEIHDIELTYMKISQQMDRKLAIRNLPNILTIFNNTDRIVSEILIPAWSSSDETVLKEVASVFPYVVCIASADFVKVITVAEDFRAELCCDKCRLPKAPEDAFAIRFRKKDLDLSVSVLKNVLKFLTYNSPDLKLAALGAIPVCSRHILKFYSENVARIWVEKAGDGDARVRRKFGEVAAEVLRNGLENQVLAETSRNDVVDVILSTLLKLAKKALQNSDAPLQETLLDNLQEISSVECEGTVLRTLKILIYFIMVPTSRCSLIAVNRFVQLAKLHEMTPNQLYRQYKREICELIAHLCVVNQTLVNYPLEASLYKISVTLEFYNAKDFLVRECQHILPFFVAKVIKTPVVGKLVDQMATALNSGRPEMLASIYGNIFLHVFLNESKADFKQCNLYLEKATGLPLSTLRRRNLWVILNELLLNFHEKKDMVLMALRYLANEDSDNKTDNVQDYLQSRLLGLLQHFDFKLMAKNSNRKGSILLSLADFFKYMGPSHIGPLRFKVIAMLRTADCGAFPELNCEVWNAFVRSCDVESLAPQLATIFVSLLPLIKVSARRINDIFKYLVVENEKHTKDFIKDLFFVDDQKVDVGVLQTIRKYTRPFDDYPLKAKMGLFLKYLTHETAEVRIRSLKQLKMLMERSREELDRMILGYNGIDPIIVELIEILTLGCREKDPVLKLACGEVIGELGAVEPAHLPRRYAQNSKSFTFFIDDDAFIIGALNELTKALQGEKNTVNMDRFAVAIQEILKHYEISNDEASPRNDLWKQFPEGQQALMLPLLTSRYIVSQPQEVNFPIPIFGSGEGGSFQAWLYNWTRSLILTLPQEHQTVLNPCLPAMKQDSRILMQFLPHILLHSVISDLNGSQEKSYTEIKAVTSCFNREVPREGRAECPSASGKERQTQCTKVVFIILDFLDRWVRERQWQTGSKGRNDQNLAKTRNFLERFCKLQLAKCNFHCGEYPRALMYLEDYITDNPHDTPNHLTFLTEIYAQLDEPDGVAGVTALQHTEPPIEQRILSLEVSGKLSDAAACYERLPPPLKLHHLKGLIQCYLDLDNVNTALNFARGALDRQPDFGNMLLEMQAEPLWRLGRYDDLDALLQKPEMAENSSWGVEVGAALLSFQNRDRPLFDTLIRRIKNRQVDSLGAASVEEGAYQHGYCYISRLHALNELQQVERVTYEILGKAGDRGFVDGVIKNLGKEWELRIKVVQESVRIMEPLLCLRRVAIEQSKRLLEERVPHAVPLLDSLLGESWILSAQTARAAGVHQQSYTYTLKAEEYAPPSLFVEKSKLHWLREEHEQALTTLRRGLEILLPDGSKEAVDSLSLEKRRICAEAKLLIASYNDLVSNVDNDVKTANYKEACDVHKEWETGLVSLAQFYDRRFQNFSDEERDTKGGDMQIWMISYFCKSLKYGTAYVYQSMPRLLSIWFDYGTRLLEVTDGKIRELRKNNLIKMTRLIDGALEILPAYVFLTAFSQIISRICHPQKEVYVELKAIIMKLLLHYPQQSLWMIISVIKSSYSVRAKRCVEILADPQLKTPTMVRLVRDFTGLAEKLIELCNKEVPQDVETTTVSNLLRALPRMLNKPDFSEIMIPTHKFRKLVLPNPDFASGAHNPFPNHYVHIVGIDEEVTLLRSLQRPRKITLRGSDGKGYIQMLKPKDDLRKDFRLMEFNDIVNQLLSREPESRQRRLNIRLYSVSPLNEECGLIEWIPNLVGLRPVLQSVYKQKGLGMTNKEIRDSSCSLRDPLAKKREVFTKAFLAKHPPVLGEWFRRAFPDAQSWFFARTAYIRTTAVISMVGYILGLGDRHGENILFDSTCGDTVHVDFNCLFNKGESFEWPERVPFRLTQNMVAGMGPLGVEGVFRKSCACTLRVLRTNMNTLMSIVTPFVYDPLVSWPRNVNASMHNSAERTNEQALDHVKNIKLRLQGIIVKTRDRSLSIPLSVDGQTNSLINEAMNVDNLCQMYVGWGPYL